MAIALLGSPDILLLDEPTAGIDNVSCARVLQSIAQTSHLRSTVFTSHSMEQCQQLCDRVVVMDGGQMVGQIDVKRLKLT